MKLRIAEVRRQKGLSQGDLADRLGATQSMIGKLERGERQMTFGWLSRIGNVLGVPTGELIDASDALIHVGHLGADGKIIPDDGEPWPAEIISGKADNTTEEQRYALIHPSGADQSTRRSVVVTADTPMKLPAFSKLTYSVPGARPNRDMAGRLAIIWITEQPENVMQDYVAFAGFIMPGTQPSRFHLIPLSGSPIQDAFVHWIAPIEAIEMP